MKKAALLMTFSIALFGCGPPSEKAKARGLIEACWKEQGKKSLSPADARFIAGACESKEREFKAKYGLNP